MLTNKRWYQLSAEETFRIIDSSETGLTSSEAEQRIRLHGYNELAVKHRGPLLRFLLQFHNPLLYILLVAAAVAGLLAEFIDMWVIIGVVLATVVIGFIQEGKAESSLAALKNMLVNECSVLRDGVLTRIPARELVPGDIVVIEGGDRVPADIRLFSVKNLTVDEAALTGESVPVVKSSEALNNENLSPGQQTCIGFNGTFVTRGRSQGVVVTTGKNTELGKIAGLMEDTGRVTPPIIKKIGSFTRIIIYVILGLGIITFGLGWALGYDLSYMFLATVGMIVAMIPEGLPAALIAAFAIGTMAMAKRNALIRRLPAAETLGCTTVISSDKTGTLTKNEMTVIRIYSGGRDYSVSGVGYEPKGEFHRSDKSVVDVPRVEIDLYDTLAGGFFCNNSELTHSSEGFGIKGDPTEGALTVSAAKAGIREKSRRLDEIPFEAELQFMATLHESNNGNIIYLKGSPEKVLSMCAGQQINGHVEKLHKEEISMEASSMAKDALRVLAIAYKKVSADQTSLYESDLTNLVFLGFQGMIDPPREEVIDAVSRCKKAGIRVVMITGDHVDTAKAIAEKIGITGPDSKALTGEQLQSMTDEELFAVVDEVSVYARVSPEHKYRIVNQLQKHGHVVAVTGDGVNDAPALKRADIGIAMGKTGTEVSKEAAGMVLTDDNFASIVAAVEEGRHVFNNIWKVILYLLPTNIGQGLVIGGAILLSPLVPVFALRLPIEPVQILWVNLIIAIACGIPLIWEPKEKGILERPPRDPNEKLFNPVFLRKVGAVSFISALSTFGMFLAYTEMMSHVNNYLEQAQTLAFTTLIFIQVMYLFTARSTTRSAFTFSPFSNKWVILGAGVTIALQLVIVYSDVLFGISPFKTHSFKAIWWLPLIGVSFLGFLVIEAEKLFLKKAHK
jgi:magnesium-transporting ATPase (P-type)